MDKDIIQSIKARKIPGVGDAIDAAEKAEYVGHLAKLFGKKKD